MVAPGSFGISVQIIEVIAGDLLHVDGQVSPLPDHNILVSEIRQRILDVRADIVQVRDPALVVAVVLPERCDQLAVGGEGSLPVHQVGDHLQALPVLELDGPVTVVNRKIPEGHDAEFSLGLGLGNLVPKIVDLFLDLFRGDGL